MNRLLVLHFLPALLLLGSTASANVTGAVRGVQENPIAGALVTFTSEASPALSFSDYTDAGGRYDIAIASLGIGDMRPAPFTLYQNHPNPFNPSTTVSFTTGETGFVTLAIYNLLGQRVRTLVSGSVPAGDHAVVWDGRDDAGVSVGAGVYLYRLSGGGRAETRKMLLLDGGASGTAASAMSSASAAKPASSTWTVTITGNEIEPREITGLEIADGGTYDFYVIYTGELINFHLVPIIGGTFNMGDPGMSSMTITGPPHTVILDDYEISAYEVTNIQYAQFLNEALAAGEIEMVGSDPYGKGGEWNGKRFVDLDIYWEESHPIDPEKNCHIMYDDGFFAVEVSTRRNWPVAGVTWYGAKAFAQHYGLDLPTEAEWEYAAGGGTLEYDYATDDGTIGPTKANNGGFIGHPVEVGSYPPNPLGLYDMTGNILEWCNDWYSRYPSLMDETGVYTDRNIPPVNPVVNPVGPETGEDKIARGGYYGISNPITTVRSILDPEGQGSSQEFVGYDLGFRVTRRQ